MSINKLPNVSTMSTLPPAAEPRAQDRPRETTKAWRKAERARLLAQRQALPPAERQRITPLVLNAIETCVPELAVATVGIYWPFRGEIDIRSLASRRTGADTIFALPVVVKYGMPLEFHRWRPGDRLIPGVWNIPLPAVRDRVMPDVLLVPLLGHDAAGYRLGYGGGFYDRTLATMQPRPRTVGIGYACAALESIGPHAHDIPMDAIITEDSYVEFDHGADRGGQA